MKPFLLFRGPVETQSGYGSHSRDLLQSLYEMNLFDIKIDSCPWGMTPMTALDNSEFHTWIKSNIITSTDKQPDIYIQVTIPSEFQPMGKFNVGITAGIETTISPLNWIEGCNRMDLVLTTSMFSKKVLTETLYDNKIKVNKPVKVLFEGVNTNIYNDTYTNFDLDIQEDFGYLFVGHWLQGDINEDRKNITGLIRIFSQTFSDEPVKPCLILKTSMGNYSILRRETIKTMIKQIISDIENPPSIYLVYGELSDQEMNELYNHPKVKVMISLTKGEGFGRPLLEFTMTGKPVIASNWSGHKDFLPEDKTMLIGGKLTDVHPSSKNEYVVDGSKWFSVDYEQVYQGLKSTYHNYDEYLKLSTKLKDENKSRFSLEKMKDKFKNILYEYKLWSDRM